MTEPQALTQEQKRATLAEARGWIYDPNATPSAKYIAVMCWIRPGGDYWQTEQVPDYFSDLDATHEFEMWLKSEDEHAHCCYCENLFQKHGAAAISLSAAERAEELGQILGLWKTQPSEAL